MRLEILRRDARGNIRIAHADEHVALFVGDVEIARRSSSAHAAAQVHIHAQPYAAFIYAVAVNIVADGGDELNVKPQQAQIVRNVPAHAAGAEGDRSGI